MFASISTAETHQLSFSPLKMLLADVDTVTLTSTSRGSSTCVWKPRHELLSDTEKPHDQVDPVMALKNLRKKTAKARAKISLCQQESKQLKDYGKALFNEALRQTDTTTSWNPKKITIDCIRPHTTGPTLYGSLLYNPQAKVLNEIRTKSSSPEKYVSRYPKKSSTFRRYNYRYTVVTNKEETTEHMNKLVPLYDDDLSGNQSEQELMALWWVFILNTSSLWRLTL